MPHANYPQRSDLEGALDDAGLSTVAPSSSALDGALASAISTWKRDADWSPFLASTQETIKRFSLICERRLFLGAGLIALPSVVEIDGEEMRQVDYFLEPGNAIDEGKPFTRINFGCQRFSAPNGLAITGRWGFCEELPDDVFAAIIALAAFNLRGELQRRFSDAKVAETNAAGLIKAKESGPLRTEYQTVDGLKVVDLGATFGAWESTYRAALVGREMRMP